MTACNITEAARLLKRASMDLSRALSGVRRGGG